MSKGLKNPRIVSLLPSATEMVCALGLAESLVGVSHECDFPNEVCGLPKLTRSAVPATLPSEEIDQLVRQRMAQGESLYQLDQQRLAELQPNLIVTQGLCEVCAISVNDVRQAVRNLPAPAEILSLNPQCLGDVWSAMEDMGRAAGRVAAATVAVRALQTRVDRVRTAGQSIGTPPKVLLLEWLAPPFSAGHWNPELVRIAGAQCWPASNGNASVAMRWEDIEASNADIWIAACCGQDVDRVHRELEALLQERPLQHLPAVEQGNVWAVDGSQYFNRPGPRLVDSLEILAHIVDPLRHPQPLTFESGVRRVIASV